MDFLKKLRDSKIADNILKIAKKDLDFAEKVCLNLEDHEAKVMALVSLYTYTNDKKFLELAVKSAETDSDYLRIVEYSKYDKELDEIAGMIGDEYKRDLAYSILLEKSGNLNYLAKIRNPKIVSASLKRIALRRPYPESLTLAKMIPDPYYKCLTLMELAEKYQINVREELEEACKSIKQRGLKNWVMKKMEEWRW